VDPANGKIVPTLPAATYYGLDSDHLNTSSQYLTLGHIHRFDDGGELQTRLRHGRYERDLLASTIGFANAPPHGLDQINDSTVLTRGSKGRIGESTLTQLQSDYTNAFVWGGKKHDIITGIDFYHDDANAQLQLRQPHGAPRTPP
jgi:catecholate siderophore receptor